MGLQKPWQNPRGSNFHLTELQSAIGRIQLQRLPEWTAARTRNALQLAEALRDLSAVRVPLPPEWLTHAWYKFYAFVKPDALADGWSRDLILSEIAALGFPALSGSCSEIYLEKCFQDAGLAPAERLPVARELGDTSLMFLVHPPSPLSKWRAMPALCGRWCSGLAGSAVWYIGCRALAGLALDRSACFPGSYVWCR